MSKLSDLYSFQYGQFNTNPDNGGIYPVYGSNGIIGGYSEFNSENSPVIGHIGANAGEVVFAEGKHFVTYNGVICKIKPNHNFRYGYYVLLNSNLKKIAKGSAQPFVSYDILNSIPIPNHTHEEEDSIAELLSSIDFKISNNTSICSDLESMAKLLYDYWFVQFDFPDENGRPYKSSGGKMVWNEELKHEIPKGWKVYSLSDILSFTKGRIPNELSDVKDTNFSSPYITINVANNGFPQYCCESGMVKCQGETIMVMDGAASGDVYLGFKGSLGSTFSMLTSKRKDVSNSLIYLILKSNMIIYKKANTGSTVPHANRSFIEKMKIALPQNMETFSKEIDKIYLKIIATREENQQLASLRDFLLPMLMNGQVKVKS